MSDDFLELQNELENIINNAENTSNILEIGAKEFVKDLLKLSKPMSKISKAGYTHLVDSFVYQKSKHKNNEIEVGWGKYYGRMVEQGTRLSKKQPHLQPTFESNKDKYYKAMINSLF